MMRRTVMIALLILATALVAPAVATAQGVTVFPASGNQFETFTFTGNGFIPNEDVSVLIVSPDGEEFTLRDAGGAELVLIVQPDGGFTLTVVPANDFAGSAVGTWYARFCGSRSGTCLEGTFEIRL